MANLDKLIHEPARLAIMSVLKSCSMIEFLVLQKMIELTKGNLSSHLSKLERANYVDISKQFLRKKIPHTTIYITQRGKEAVEDYWDQLDEIREQVKDMLLTGQT